MMSTWTLKKAAISVFVTIHMAATLVWVLPECPIRRATIGAAKYYILPTGLWQNWAMFAPDPIHNTVTLEAEVVDSKGLRHHFEFPFADNPSEFQSILLARHSKFACNIEGSDMEPTRRPTARFAVRRLDLPTTSFPVDAYLVQKIKPPPRLGQAVDDDLVETKQVVLHVARFESAEEVSR